MKNLVTIWQITKCDSRKPFNPLVVLKSSKEDANKIFASYTEEIDNESDFKKVIDREENSVKLLCNHKGWGPDYITSVTIESRRIELL
jgi:hypothetical protein